MKYLLLFLLISSQAFAQQQVESKNVKLNLPNNSIKIDKIGMVENSVSDESKIQKRYHVNSFPGKKYIGRGVIKFIQFTDTAVTVRPDYIQYRKKMFDEASSGLSGKVPESSSIIRVVNGCEVLIVKWVGDTYVNYIIISTNKSHNKVFNSRIIALKRDIIEADKEVDNFVKNIRFK